MLCSLRSFPLDACCTLVEWHLLPFLLSTAASDRGRYFVDLGDGSTDRLDGGDGLVGDVLDA